MEDSSKQMGSIPKDWKIVKLGDESITDLIMGQSPPSSTYNDKGIGLPFLQGNAEFGETYPTPILSCSQPLKIAEKNDILLSVRAPVGDINIAASKSCIGRGLAAIRPKHDKLDHLFLFYYLRFGSRKFESLSMGSTFKAIRKEEVVKFQIPLPPLPEQRRIAEVLGTVDSAIQKVGGAIERTERLKKGLMQRLLTKGIGHERFKETEVGRVPEEWEIVQVGDITDEHKQGFYTSENYSEEGINLVRITDLQNPEIAYLKMPKIKIDDELFKQFKVDVGDFLIARSGAIGRYGIVKSSIPCVFASYIIRFRFDSCRVDNLYFGNLFESFYISNELKKITQGATNKNINAYNIKKIKIPLPPLPEQRRIAEILSAADRKLALSRRRKEKLERVKKGLMNELLTGRKRVKVMAEMG